MIRGPWAGVNWSQGALEGAPNTPTAAGKDTQRNGGEASIGTRGGSLQHCADADADLYMHKGSLHTRKTSLFLLRETIDKEWDEGSGFIVISY